ncbi:MAG: hypothetical protein ACRCXB_13605 [Aeromonadaceae bacterium]
MKKLLLVGVVGLSALLGGCGGGGDCEEEVLPPVTEASFPRGQAPEYIIRMEDEIGFSKVNTKENFSGQVLFMESNENPNYVALTVQEFTADYSQGYVTKPTNNIREFEIAYLTARFGNYSEYIKGEDIDKIQDQLLTVKLRGGQKLINGNILPNLDITFPILGELQEESSTFYKINGMYYPKGSADDGVYVGRHVVGLYEGDKLNIFSMAFAGPAWGYVHTVTVDAVVDGTHFTYIDGDGFEISVDLKAPVHMEKTDRLLNTEGLVSGMKVTVMAGRVDYNKLETINASVYLSGE